VGDDRWLQICNNFCAGTGPVRTGKPSPVGGGAKPIVGKGVVGAAKTIIIGL
jgi:hypothetical protein